MKKKAIIIGASSGIGKELSKVLSQNNYEVALTGRRITLLRQISDELPNKSCFKRIDVTDIQSSIKSLEELISQMKDVNLIIISAGTGHINPDLDWNKEKNTIDTNVTGFCAMTNVAMKHFQQQGYGHLVGISSIARIRGNAEAPAYNASKAFVSNYMEGLRTKTKHTNITITDIQPGFVDTDMAKGDHLFWVASPQKVAKQIFNAILKKKKVVYVSKRWRLIALLLKILPERFL